MCFGLVQQHTPLDSTRHSSPTLIFLFFHIHFTIDSLHVKIFDYLFSITFILWFHYPSFGYCFCSVLVCWSSSSSSSFHHHQVYYVSGEHFHKTLELLFNLNPHSVDFHRFFLFVLMCGQVCKYSLICSYVVQF